MDDCTSLVCSTICSSVKRNQYYTSGWIKLTAAAAAHPQGSLGCRCCLLMSVHCMLHQLLCVHVVNWLLLVLLSSMCSCEQLTASHLLRVWLARLAIGHAPGLSWCLVLHTDPMNRCFVMPRSKDSDMSFPRSRGAQNTTNTANAEPKFYLTSFPDDQTGELETSHRRGKSGNSNQSRQLCCCSAMPTRPSTHHHAQRHARWLGMDVPPHGTSNSCSPSAACTCTCTVLAWP